MKGPPVFLTFHNSAQSVMSRLRVTTWPSRCPPLYKSMFNSKNFSLIRHTESVPCVQVCLQMLPRFVIPFSIKVHLCLFSNNFLDLNVCWGHNIARLPRGVFDFDSTNSEIAREKKQISFSKSCTIVSFLKRQRYCSVVDENNSSDSHRWILTRCNGGKSNFP